MMLKQFYYITIMRQYLVPLNVIFIQHNVTLLLADYTCIFAMWSPKVT